MLKNVVVEHDYAKGSTVKADAQSQNKLLLCRFARGEYTTSICLDPYTVGSNRRRPPRSSRTHGVVEEAPP